jgi:2-phospho-L-lactate/phosphoenolpyruvate guanylyltransferase
VPAAQDPPRWIVVVPVKRLDRAKSRMRLPAAERAALVLAMLDDTLQAARSADGVASLLVITSDPAATRIAADHGIGTVADPGRGLNAAVRRGLHVAARLHGAAERLTGFAALTGDLPALRPDHLAAALAAARSYAFALVADRVGTGTTLLTTARGHRAEPHFGRGSRAAHVRAGAHELTDSGWETLRCDVDVLDDLEAAATLRVGPRTASVLMSLRRSGDLARIS